MPKLTRPQKITIWGIVVGALITGTGIAVAHYDSKAKNAGASHSAGNATTQGSESPAVTGDGNVVGNGDIKDSFNSYNYGVDADPLKLKIQKTIKRLEKFQATVVGPGDNEKVDAFDRETAHRYYKQFAPVMKEIAKELKKRGDRDGSEHVLQRLRGYENENSHMDTGTIDHELDDLRKLLGDVISPQNTAGPIPRKSKKPVIQNAPQGIAIGGDNNGTAIVNNGPPPLEIKWSSIELRPDDFPYGRTALVRSNQIYSPVSLLVTCDNEIKAAWVVGVTMMSQIGVLPEDHRKALVYYESPALSPGMELRIGIAAEVPVQILAIQQIQRK